ncbi:MAG: helicase, partial [Alphaproteobacteria bacterium]|nr:helicase [Alphaproteobacteria bacterium]
MASKEITLAIAANTANAWIAVDHGLAANRMMAQYTLRLKGERSLYQAIADDDCVLVLNTADHITRVGRVLRVRSDLETTTIYFDRMLLVDPAVSIGLKPFTPPASGSVGRIQWTDFLESLSTAFHRTIAEVPTIADQAYIRELLQLSVMDDLLGPAGGPRERIVDMGVRDRYLVGKLAPRETAQGGIEGLQGPMASDDVEEPTDPTVPGQHEPGAEFGTATGRVEPEADATDEIDASSNQSLVPSSLGMTFCV